MTNYINACTDQTGLFWSIMRFNMGITESIRDMPCTELLAYSYLLLVGQALFVLIVLMYATDKAIKGVTSWAK